MSQSVRLYFLYSSLQYDTPKSVHDTVYEMLDSDGALTPRGLFEEGVLEEVRVVANHPFEVEANVILERHDGFVDAAIDTAEREDKYRTAIVEEYEPHIVGVQFD